MNLQHCLQFSPSDRATELAIGPAAIRTLHYHGTIRLDRIAIKAGTLTGTSAEGERLQVTRTINYNPNGSRHLCNAACRHAKGRECECSCGGRNHGINR